MALRHAAGARRVAVPAGVLDADGLTFAWTLVFFFASPAASAAYLTVGESFPLETRALSIALVLFAGTAIGGVAGPLVFGRLIGAGDRGHVFARLYFGGGAHDRRSAGRARDRVRVRATVAGGYRPAAGADRRPGSPAGLAIAAAALCINLSPRQRHRLSASPLHFGSAGMFSAGDRIQPDRAADAPVPSDAAAGLRRCWSRARSRGRSCCSRCRSWVASILQSLNASINAVWVGRLIGAKALTASCQRQQPACSS